MIVEETSEAVVMAQAGAAMVGVARVVVDKEVALWERAAVDWAVVITVWVTMVAGALVVLLGAVGSAQEEAMSE